MAVDLEEIFIVGCVYDCGAKERFYDSAEYEVYGDDWVCDKCKAKHVVTELSCN